MGKGDYAGSASHPLWSGEEQGTGGSGFFPQLTRGQWVIGIVSRTLVAAVVVALNLRAFGWWGLFGVPALGAILVSLLLIALVGFSLTRAFAKAWKNSPGLRAFFSGRNVG